MKLFITIPSTNNPHGGLRVILEWANRLTKYHEVYLYNLSGRNSCHWFEIDKRVKIADIGDLWHCDTAILTSPHSAHLLDIILPGQKCFLFLQMLEDMFNPKDLTWLSMCHKFYTSNYPMICISKWNIDVLRNRFGRRGTIHYIGNGINTNDFPIFKEPKQGNVVLIEGWEASNPTKDAYHVAHEVAKRLRSDGCYIVSYGHTRLKTDRHVPHVHHFQPSLQKMNELYEQATILVKATICDARSCSPIEAMTKGTPTARAINNGDDDLEHEYNCLRCEYDADDLYANARRLLDDRELYERISNNCIEYARQLSWDPIIEQVNDILCNG